MVATLDEGMTVACSYASLTAIVILRHSSRDPADLLMLSPSVKVKQRMAKSGQMGNQILMYLCSQSLCWRGGVPEHAARFQYERDWSICRTNGICCIGLNLAACLESDSCTCESKLRWQAWLQLA